ncbi:MAG: LptF/LptG family permease [Bacteroidota bacterium]|nr:LptF/LptG family permease [Bacteroidota bacterium]MDP4230610.1 LptF/LptG family permease [Bacteroidota bacterium]MDP4235701.1 LptF/LptG family permease [Bacteroidota bacterium]
MQQETYNPLKRQWWRTSFRVWGYILVAHIGPFFLAFIVIMFVFLLQFLMRFIDKIVGKGLDVWTIIRLIGLNLAWMVVLAMPMAALVASLMAFGSLAASNEMTAMKASGVSFMRMLFPALVLGLVLAYADLVFNNDVLPDANHAAKDMMSDIQRKKPTFIIRAGEFSDEDALPGYSILARKTAEHSSDLEGVTIYDHSTGNETRVLTAKTANLSFTPDFRKLVLKLHNGELHQFFNNQPNDYRRGVFETYTVRIPTSGFDFMRQGESERGGRELSAHDLMTYVVKRDSAVSKQAVVLSGLLKGFADNITDTRKASIPDSSIADSLRKPMVVANFRQNLFQIPSQASQVTGTQLDSDSYLVEVHKKYALPAACLIFIFLGAPLGALAKRGGIGMGVGLSIGFFILYWAFLIGGEKLADRGLISPFSGMWSANILLGILGGILTIRVLRERRALGFAWLAPLFKRKKANDIPAS